MNLVKFSLSQNKPQSGQDSFELIPSDDVFSQVVKIKEELFDSDSFEDDLSLNFPHDFLDW